MDSAADSGKGFLTRRLASDIRTSDISIDVRRNDNGVGADPSTPLLFLTTPGLISVFGGLKSDVSSET
jgi:hypothetical protein